MKNILNITIFSMVIGWLSTSCEMDRYPFDAILAEEGFQTMADAHRHNNGHYAYLRSRVYGGFMQNTEWQSDLYNATIGHTNTPALHRMAVTMLSDGNVGGVWSSAYSAIGQLNNFLVRIHEVEEPDLPVIARYIAEAHYFRAYYYYILIRHFGANYDPATAADLPGVPLITVLDRYAQPSPRASLAEVYDFIMSEIALAEEGGITTQGAQRSDRVTIDAVRALKAKIQLLMHDFEGAATTANAIISTGRYPLATTEATIRSGWHSDNWTEDIFLLFMATGTAADRDGTGTQGSLVSWNAADGAFAPGYIPTQTVLDLYAAGDRRRAVFFSNIGTDFLMYRSIEYRGVYFMTKWPGNALTRPSSGANYFHRPKVHRIAEQYLIAAEALAHPNNPSRDEAQALTRLNQLRTARGLAALTQWDEQEMRNEWVREMIGEGVRIECLKRWNVGINGRVPQNTVVVLSPEGAETTNLICPPGYYRFTWPVPLTEMRTNPNISQTPEWVTPQ